MIGEIRLLLPDVPRFSRAHRDIQRFANPIQITV
jgi:hypothetical protein